MALEKPKHTIKIILDVQEGKVAGIIVWGTKEGKVKHLAGRRKKEICTEMPNK